MSAAMKFSFALFAVALGACAVGQGEVDVSESRTATFPGAPAGVSAHALEGVPVTTEAEVTLDLKKDIASLSELGTLTVDISKDSLSGTVLESIRHIKATIASADGTMPAQVASDVDVPEKTTEMELPLLISGTELVAFLAEGPVTLRLSLTGTIPPQSFTLQYALIAHVNVAVNNSISKL
jgi:hypothetical protein